MTAPIPIQMSVVEGKTFVGANIQVDGFARYRKCNFQNCMMLYNGGNLMLESSCTTSDCNWQIGALAANTIACLKNLFAMGGREREMVESIITNIRTVPPPGPQGPTIKTVQ